MKVSKNNPLYFVTSVIRERLPLFTTDPLRQTLCDALDEARRSSGMSIFAYAVMPDHLYMITDSKLSHIETMRYINGMSARQMINFLKVEGDEETLAKIRTTDEEGGYRYSMWEQYSNTFDIDTDTVLMERVDYIHNNPVAERLVDEPDSYLFSSARIWNGCPLETEPLELDL